VRQLTRNAVDHEQPEINDAGHVVWSGLEEGERYVYLWDGSTTRRLTERGQFGARPRISENSHVLWQSGLALYIWDGRRNHRISGEHGDPCCEQMNALGQVTWVESGGFEAEIYLWDGTRTRRITRNARIDLKPQINRAAQIVWQGYDGEDEEIFLWDGRQIRQLTDNPVDDVNPQINDAGHVVWERWERVLPPMGELRTDVILWEGGEEKRLTNDGRRNGQVRINNAGQVAWMSISPSQTLAPGTFGRLLLWTRGETREIARNTANFFDSRYSWSLGDGGQLLWIGWDSADAQTFLWTGSEVRQLTHGPAGVGSARLNAVGQAAWTSFGNMGVFLWDGAAVRRLAAFPGGPPAINRSGQVVWTVPDGRDTEIYLYQP
jgi:hypothetical protein